MADGHETGVRVADGWRFICDGCSQVRVGGHPTIRFCAADECQREKRRRQAARATVKRRAQGGGRWQYECAGCGETKQSAYHQTRWCDNPACQRAKENAYQQVRETRRRARRAAARAAKQQQQQQQKRGRVKVGA